MSLQFAMAVAHMSVSGLEFPALGLNKFSAYDTQFGTKPPDTTSVANKLSTLERSGSAHAWTMMPNFVVPSAVRKVYIGARFSGLIKANGDPNTAPFAMNINGSKFYPFQAITVQAQIVPAREVYLELEIDRDANTINGFIDGTPVGTLVTINATHNGWLTTPGFFFGVAARNYNDPTPVLVSDIQVVYKDGVYPENRLGSVNIRPVPVKVTSVKGFDKTASEMEAIVNAKVTNVTGKPITKGNVAKASGTDAEVAFTLDLSGVDVSRQVAAGIFVGAQRTGAAGAGVTLERTLDGVAKTEQAVDLTARSADRMNFTTPMAARTTTSTRSLNDITHKLKIVEA